MRLPIIVRTQTVLSSLLGAMLAMTGCSGGGTSSSGGAPSAQAAGTPGAEQAVGERLFLETRFAQAFKVFLDNNGNVNDPNAGDPVVDTVETTIPGSPVPGSISPGPFSGLSMNCRACHMVEDLPTAAGVACGPTPTSLAEARFLRVSMARPMRRETHRRSSIPH